MLPVLLGSCFAVMLLRAGSNIYLFRSGARIRVGWMECVWPLVCASWYVANWIVLQGGGGWSAAFLTLIVPCAFAVTLAVATINGMVEARRDR